MAERRYIYKCMECGAQVHPDRGCFDKSHPAPVPVEVFTEAEALERLKARDALIAAAKAMFTPDLSGRYNLEVVREGFDAAAVVAFSDHSGGEEACDHPTPNVGPGGTRQCLDCGASLPASGGRSITEIRNWVTERQDFERRNAPTQQNTPASGMTIGALEVLGALKDYLNGDDDA